jgi:UDP-N-acetylglucosamine acyltransferase
MNRGSAKGGGTTSVGNNGFFMAYSHVAHDCHIGNDVTMANGVALGGHVEIGHGANIGGLSAIQQHSRIGHNAFVGGVTGVPNDVIPYGLVWGDHARLQGLNLIGLKRAGVDGKEIQDLKKAYDHLFSAEGTFAERLDTVEQTYGGRGTIDTLVGFLRAETSRPILQPEEE